jgi:tRNA pseudouridine55 synthase
MRSGLYLVHKPVGATSFAQVLEARTVAGPSIRLCHGGTLDPFAQGLLLLLAGPATRMMDLLHELPKQYVAQVKWGEETDTGDGGGSVVFRGDPTILTAELLDRTLETQMGWKDQVPPATSAKKIDGEPAYRKAHRGESVVLPPSRVYLHAARWRSHRLPFRSELELTCRGGYYVRALARDLGQQLGCGAHLTDLDRVAIGPWTSPSPGREREGRHGSRVVPWLPRTELDESQWQTLRARKAITLKSVQTPEWTLPEKFPDPTPLVAALYRGQLLALLSETKDAQWEIHHWLAPGL